MLNNSEILKDIERNINNGQFDIAHIAISNFNPELKDQERKVNHLKAKLHLFKGEYRNCVKSIHQIEEEYGQHIGLLADKCCALYMMEDFIRWQEATKELEIRLDEYRNILSNSTYIKSAICLGKFKEELGEINESLLIYKNLLSNLDKVKEDYPMVLAQIVRLKSKWKLSKDLNTLYKDLFTINEERYHTNFNIELNHSLLVTELELFGFEIAFERYENIKSKLDKQDRALFLSEIIEYLLKNNKGIQDNIINEFSKVGESSFEKNLGLLSQGKEAKIKSMPIHSSLTLYSIMISKNMKKDILYRDQFNFLIQSFSTKTKALWQALISTDVLVEIKLEGSVVSYKSKSIDLNRKKVALALVKAMTEKKVISLEDLTLLIWGNEYNDSFYHRIRIAIKRLNTELSSALIINDLFFVDSAELKINTGFSITQDKT
ncbi:hypothetical protein ACRXCV_05725 [Halobacteriovorax sp. GFR7]|uniref:hypothetical protein n=1 Tax=unclassified Halobacteriovorax TaxID=2639665 RepID=UPI003D95780B